MLTILLLGQPQIVLDGQPLKLARRKSRALLFYLAAQTRPVSRDQLLALFWPDLERPAAQQVLRTTLHGLRQALGSWLISSDESLALAADVQVDARRLQSAVSEQGVEPEPLREALELYRGELLENFSLPDSDLFEDWLGAERERYRQLLLRGLTRLSALYEQRGRYRRALEALDRALGFDPLQEDLQRAALRLLYLAGDRAGAIRRYEALRRLLDEELGLPPMAETRALYDAIITDALPVPSSEPLPLAAVARAGLRPFLAGARPARPPAIPAGEQALPFVGRAAELERLAALHAEGSRRLALVEGEPGIGKTRLLDEYLAGSGALVLRGAGRELEQAMPYHPVAEALRGLLLRPDCPDLRATLHGAVAPVWLAETARLLPALLPDAPPPAGAPDEARLWEGLSQVLGALAARHPLIVVIDDLHWADASTLALLGYLVRQPSSQLWYLAATRPAQPRSALATLLQSLTREDRLARLALGRLEGAEVELLARQLRPRGAEQLAEWLLRSSEGNPYMLAELARQARAAGLLAAGERDLGPLIERLALPSSILSLVQSRLARLSEQARRVLDVAVVVGRNFEFDVVSRAAGLSELATLDALDELHAAGLIVPLEGMRYRFDHSMTMEGAWSDVGETRHRLLHRRVAEALKELYARRLDSVAGLIAWHYGEGHAPELAAPFALRAGQLAAALAAWTEAIAFFEQALEGSAGDAQRLAILMDLGEARRHAGQLAPGSEALRMALSLALELKDPSAVTRARLALAGSLLTQARYAEVIALVSQIPQGDDPDGLLSAAQAQFAWGAALSVEGADLDAAVEHLHLAEALFARASAQLDRPLDPLRLAPIFFELGSVLAQQGDLPGAIASYQQALKAARQAHDPLGGSYWVVLSLNNLAYHMQLAGDEQALSYAEQGLQLAREQGKISLQTYLLSTLGEIALARGELAVAEQHFSAGLALAERLAMPERIAGLTANLGRVAASQGQTTLAIHRLSSALARADTLGTLHLAAKIRLWLAPLLPPAEAHAHLVEARAIAERGGRRHLLAEASQVAAQLPPEE